MVDKAKKISVVKDLQDSFGSAKTIVVAQYKSLTIPESDELRKLARKNGAKVKIVKNRLAQVALKDSAHSGIIPLFKSQTVIAYSDDILASAKTLVKFAKDNEKVIISGGSNEGKALDLAGVNELANIPSIDESRAMIVHLLNAPAAKLVRILSTYAKEGGAKTEGADAAPAAGASEAAAPAAPAAEGTPTA